MPEYRKVCVINNCGQSNATFLLFVTAINLRVLPTEIRNKHIWKFSHQIQIYVYIGMPSGHHSICTWPQTVNHAISWSFVQTSVVSARGFSVFRTCFLFWLYTHSILRLISRTCLCVELLKIKLFLRWAMYRNRTHIK